MRAGDEDHHQEYQIQGHIVRLPAVVRDASSASVIYLVSSAAAQQLLPRAFQILEIAPGQAQVVLGFVDYRDNDLGDYNEVMIVFFVRPAADADAADGIFIYKLPVNQAFTCEAGRTIWGLPKTVEQIDIVTSPGESRCTLVMEGQHVFTLTVPRTAADDAGDVATEMTSYTCLERPAAFTFAQGGPTGLNPGAAGVRLELGTHPLANELRQLGLPDAPALLSTWVEHMRGSFGPCRPLLEDADRS